MKRGLLERLDSDGVVCAKGNLFEMERRGYLTAGEFVPEVTLDHPEALKILNQDFQHTDSDVTEVFTYNGHREKIRKAVSCHMAALPIPYRTTEKQPTLSNTS